MRRVLCVLLPSFLTDLLEREARYDRPHNPLVIAAPGKGGNRLVAVNAQAQTLGLRPEMLLADAQALVPELRTAPHTPDHAAKTLTKLARWHRRYAPWAGVDAPDGIWIETSGSAHLFGGEHRLACLVRANLGKAGFSSRIGIASTNAAAWGLARYGRGNIAICPQGQEHEQLGPLPINALGLDRETAGLLKRLGLTTIEHAVKIPRPALRARFGSDLCDRLDRVFGLAGDAQSALRYERDYAARTDFDHPASTLASVSQIAEHLAGIVCEELKADGKGARRFLLQLFDTQGGTVPVVLNLARASHDASHVVKLFGSRLAALESRFEDAAAFDAASLEATRIERLVERQAEFEAKAETAEALSQLLDRLAARFGDGAVKNFAFPESHIPERAAIQVPAPTRKKAGTLPETAPRPLLLLPRPEPILAMAELPDYPPRMFIWRRLQHRVVKSEGPERIAPEWWQHGEDSAQTRDYYAVEDTDGRRYWLYREGIYGSETQPVWFMHGLFP
jgi:protein ImuB